MFFDTHAHYDDQAFDTDRDELLPAINAGGVDRIIDSGCTLSSSAAALAMAERYGFLYAAVGIHPEELGSRRSGDMDELRRMARHEKCVAIGEIGLDYYWDSEHKAEQKELFRQQLELALELGKPVIVHDREAHGDCLQIVSEYPGLRGVFHCYSGSAEMAEGLLRLGWYLGFDGPVTYKNARKTIEVLERCPVERLLIETDSPYLSPVPLRGKRNDSRNLGLIAQRIAEVKGLSLEETARISSDNAGRLFGVK